MSKESFAMTLAAVLLVTAVGGASFSPGASAMQDETARRIDAHLSALVPWGFSGNLLVARRDTVLLIKGYGLANRESGISFGPRTQIPIGSIAKRFTQAAIQLLVEGGKLRLTDSLGRYFPDLPADKGVITINHLLAHSSGLPASVGGPEVGRTRAAFLQAVGATPLLFSPGDRSSYSNAGYSVLAAVIEQLSGKDFESFIRERFLLPNGIHETGWHFPRWDSARVGRTYARGTIVPTGLAYPRAEGPRPFWGSQGAGAWMSTLDDLHRWSRISATILERSSRPLRPGESFASLGGNEAFETAIRSYPSDSIVIVLHNNVSGSLSEHLSEQVGRLALGQRLDAPPPPRDDWQPITSAVAGVYVLQSGGTITAAPGAGHVTLTPSGQDAFDLLFDAPAAGSGQRLTLAARTDSVMKATLAGDWSALAGATETATAVERRRAAAAGLGAFVAHRVIGVIATPAGGHGIVALSYERGTRYERFGWAGSRVGLHQFESEPPSVHVRWTGSDLFVQFRLSNATYRAVRLSPSQGNARGVLTIATPSGDVTAVRERKA
ncbi:MAG TPA: serine hydrolase domain-containing protein [Gemmatimonadaceae bacterium]|nr:serine hydrolase domain-containing protein [Gemmatimonadaceae bacterium]